MKLLQFCDSDSIVLMTFQIVWVDVALHYLLQLEILNQRFTLDQCCGSCNNNTSLFDEEPSTHARRTPHYKENNADRPSFLEPSDGHIIQLNTIEGGLFIAVQTVVRLPQM